MNRLPSIHWKQIVPLAIIWWLILVSICLPYTLARSMQLETVGLHVAWRINDVVNEAYPDLNIDTAVTMQEKFTKERAVGYLLDHMMQQVVSNTVHRRGLVPVDPNEAEVNRVVKETNKICYKYAGHEIDAYQDELKAAVFDAAGAMADSASGLLMGNGRLFGLIYVYNGFTSWMFQTVAAAAVLAILYVQSEKSSAVMAASMGTMMLAGGALHDLVGLVLKLLFPALSNTWLGRTMSLSVSAWMVYGLASMACGTLFLLIFRFMKKRTVL